MRESEWGELAGMLHQLFNVHHSRHSSFVEFESGDAELLVPGLVVVVASGELLIPGLPDYY